MGRIARAAAGPVCLAALLAGAQPAGAASSTVTVGIGAWWAPQLPLVQQEWAKEHPDILWLTQAQIEARVMSRSPANRRAYDISPWNDEGMVLFATADQGSHSSPGVAGWFQLQDTLILELQKVPVRQQTPQQAADNAAKKMAQVIADAQ